MTKRIYKDRSTGLRFTELIGASDAPVVEVTGFGYSSGFAERDGKQVTYLVMRVPASVDALPLGRDRGAGNRDRDPDKAMVALELDQQTRMSLLRHLLETSMEYDRAFPVVARKRTSPGFRSRS